MVNAILQKILVIDDDITSRNAITKMLLSDYQVQSANDGISGIVKAQDWQPELIVLDVEMPGKNGYEVCDLLKSADLTKQIPVIFVSSHNTLRERMLGYEAGAEDFLEKPCDAAILKTKVRRLIEARTEKDSLSVQAERAKVTALEAMLGSSELGKAIRYVESTYGIGDYDELAGRLFEFLEELNLKTCLMFSTTQGPKFYSQTHAEILPLEKELIEMLHSTNRFYDFGCRTQINYINVSLLIKNMPLADRERYGRMKDVLPFVLGATDEKVRILDTEYALRSQSENLSRSIKALKSTLSKITASMQSNQENITRAVRGLLEELDTKLPTMGLEEDQETLIIALIDKAFSRAIDHVDSNKSLKASLDGVVRLLQYLTDEQNQIVENAVNHNHLRQDSEIEFNDIELF